MHSRPLLKRIEVQLLSESDIKPAWIFSRNPHHWFLMNIPAGGLLIEKPSPSPMYRDPLSMPDEPWSVYKPTATRGRWSPWLGIPADVAEDLFRLDKIDRTPAYREALEVVGDWGEHRCRFHYLEIPVPAASLERGDLLVWAYQVRDRPELRGRVRELQMSDYEALRSSWKLHKEELCTDITPVGSARWHRLSEFLKCPNRWGRRLKTWHSRILAVRSLREVVSQPIVALSDDGAIFELLADVGCRLR
jgi:hypothetical protein